LRGDYEAIPGDDHVVAFTRAFGSQRLLCCVPRLVRSLTNDDAKWPLGAVWGTTEIAIRHAGRYRNLFTDAHLEISRKVAISEVLAEFPVALLIMDSTENG
jgi:maltooligosyltrehalose synthase